MQCVVPTYNITHSIHIQHYKFLLLYNRYKIYLRVKFKGGYQEKSVLNFPSLHYYNACGNLYVNFIHIKKAFVFYIISFFRWINKKKFNINKMTIKYIGTIVNVYRTALFCLYVWWCGASYYVVHV